MTDVPRVPGDPQPDAELEHRLRAAFRAASAPDAPAGLHAQVTRLAAAPEARTHTVLAGWPSWGWVAVALAVSVLVVGSVLSGGSDPAPTVPSVPSAAVCGVSPGTIHGTWWREIGGPNAFFNWDEGPRPAGSAPWKVFVRFEPDADSVDGLSMWAERIGSDERAVAVFNSRMDPSAIFRFDQPAPELPGGLYLFEQRLPTPGCWRLSAAVDDLVVGTAIVEVAGEPSQGTPSPTGGPTPATEPSPTAEPPPEAEATPWPAFSMAPSADDVLALAGRDGVPGLLVCANMPITLEALDAPLGAEVRVGPEYDALRAHTVGAPDRDGSLGPSFREVSRDDDNVLFLREPAEPGVVEAGPYLVVKVTFDGATWRTTGGGDCRPLGIPGTGFGQAIWKLDPAFPRPDADTRTLHILVMELACSGGQSASGRISPAFVVVSRKEIAIQLFVQHDPGDCQGNSWTPATLRLPGPIGDRTLFDVGTLGLGGAGG